MPSPQEGSGAEVEGSEEVSVVESVEEVEGSVVTAAEVLEEVLLSAEEEEVGSESELEEEASKVVSQISSRLRPHSLLQAL
jgi:hypothetical protein